MSERFVPRRVENYTRPFLITMGCLTFMGLWTLATVAGTMAMLLTAAMIDIALKLAMRRARA